MTTHIYVDVDGVLNAISDHPWDANPTWDRNRWQSFHAGPSLAGNNHKYLIQYNEEVMEAIRELEALPDTKVFWLTTWTHDAPTELAPTFGIGADWEVVDDLNEDGETFWSGWWKWGALQEHNKLHKPDKIVWMDDDHGYYRHTVPEFDHILKICPSTFSGLENHHFDRINAFLED